MALQALLSQEVARKGTSRSRWALGGLGGRSSFVLAESAEEHAGSPRGACVRRAGSHAPSSARALPCLLTVQSVQTFGTFLSFYLMWEESFLELAYKLAQVSSSSGKPFPRWRAGWPEAEARVPLPIRPLPLPSAGQAAGSVGRLQASPAHTPPGKEHVSPPRRTPEGAV